jgi:hypothetical protein
MASPSKTFYFRASANALGGSLDSPQKKMVPAQASASLPAVGGHVTSRTDSCNCDEIACCRAAYTRVTGTNVEEDGSWATLSTSVIEGLNILDVVKADRVVAQVSVEHPADGGAPTFSLAGSHFDGLRLGGVEVTPTLNATLLGVGLGDGIDWATFQKTGANQAVTMVKKAAKAGNAQWVLDRFNWMTQSLKTGSPVLCSLVDLIDPSVPGRSFGHALEIPHFGKIFLAELVVDTTAIQLSMVRAELGCAHSGNINAAMSIVSGGTVPPS